MLLDGTSWKSGGTWFHYITLCVVYQGVGIPIYWLDLSKQGTSNFKERRTLIKKAMKRFDLQEKTLIADREYIGIDWFKFLIASNLDFVIRLKAKAYKEYISASAGQSYEGMIRKVMRSKKPNKAIKKAFQMEGMDLYFVVAKNPDQQAKEPYILMIGVFFNGE